jgi:Flp pilus assembly protein TadG
MRRHVTNPDPRERGATLVEFAFVFPILLLIFIGIAELGVAFKGHLTASYASREGARVAAFVGDAAEADCEVVKAVAGILINDLDNLDRIEIYRVSQSGVPQSSDTNTARYLGGDPQLCNSPDDALDSWTRTNAWPSNSRQVVLGSQPLDIIGVRVVLNQDWITGFGPFGGSLGIDEATIMRLEPEAYD